MFGIFVLFLGFVVVAVVVVFMYCDKLRILSRLFYRPHNNAGQFLFLYLFSFAFLLSFWYRGNLDANAQGRRRTCDTQLLTHLPLSASAG
jgi:hypothetical protein